MKIYISGPITGISNHAQLFDYAEQQLSDLGVEVINPARILDGMPKSTTHSEYMMVCIELMKQCDSMLMLPGWSDSVGACFEHHYAETMRMIVYNSLDEIIVR